MLYFHVNAFHGEEEEGVNVRQLIAELGVLQDRRTVAIDYSQENRNDREKAVHRLVILGVIEDYTNDYAHNQIHLRLSGIDKESVLHHYREYIRAYDPRLAETTEANTRRFMSLDFLPFVETLVRELLEFIYRTVELGRRRSLQEMLQACTSGRLRQNILNYLQLGAYSELLASAMDRKEPLGSVISQLVEQVTSPNDAAELRGQTARLLESYPDNPALLFIRSIAECLCSEFDEKIVVDNLCAAIQFALSETGWALPLDEVATAVAHLTEIAFRNDESLGTQIVESFLNTAHELRPAARAIIEKSSPNETYRAAEALVGLLSDQIEDILN
jgi:ATP-dependent DNA helicase RecQ